MQLRANFVSGEAFFGVVCGQSGEKNNDAREKICHKCAEV